MKNFSQEFLSFSYVLNRAESVLLIAHDNPDADTVGANIALQKILTSQNKKVTIVCNDPFPESLSEAVSSKFTAPEKIVLSDYDAVIACDSVERGPFASFQKNFSENQVGILLDHHPRIDLSADIRMIDEEKSSTCELLYDFLLLKKIPIDKEIATALLLGILFDTGNFQHPNTTTRVLEIASELLKKGAPLEKLIHIVSSNKKLSTLRLWGKAFEKMRIIKKNKMAVTILTQKDLDELGAQPEDTSQIAQILSTIPDVRYGLVLHQKNPTTVKGSFRAQEQNNVDVCLLAKNFGGGGHKLASGFEISGTLKEKEGVWVIE